MWQLYIYTGVAINTPYYICAECAYYICAELNFLSLYPEYFCIPQVYTAAGVISIQYIIAVCFIVVTLTHIHLDQLVQ